MYIMIPCISIYHDPRYRKRLRDPIMQEELRACRWRQRYRKKSRELPSQWSALVFMLTETLAVEVMWKLALPRIVVCIQPTIEVVYKLHWEIKTRILETLHEDEGNIRSHFLETSDEIVE